ncbi:hypothetical protein SDC9_152324 [bioreactor metagenome]|uniref:Polysaccharide biosynthesis protein C-terminal domain-containing protein n=1 Tax=bioreactor metagenome TaxID=1076179 RepID=A0A645EXA5_9ZZZZ
MRNAQFMYRPASAAAGFFIAAVFGALLDPILSGALGALGMAYYSLAMPAYALITVAGTAVFPAVIALMIAPRAKAGENEEVRSLFADSLLALVLPGAALGMLTALLASPVASLSNLYGGASALVGIAPLFLLSAAAAAFRGYFLGTGGYGIFALSVLVQQIGKVLLCPLLAGLGRGDPARMAEWACFGICIAEGLSLLMLAVLFAANRRSQKKQAEGERERGPLIGLARKLWRTGGLTTV